MLYSHSEHTFAWKVAFLAKEQTWQVSRLLTLSPKFCLFSGCSCATWGCTSPSNAHMWSCCDISQRKGHPSYMTIKVPIPGPQYAFTGRMIGGTTLDLITSSVASGPRVYNISISIWNMCNVPFHLLLFMYWELGNRDHVVCFFP